MPPFINQDERIKVAIRIRPPLGREEEHESAINVIDDRTLVIFRSKSKNEMQFDRVFNASTTQEGIFEEIRENIISVLEGYNSTVFAYGQTGTGKTHTMLGNLGPYFVPQEFVENEEIASNEDEAIATALSLRDEHGIIPRSIRYMFDFIQKNSDLIRFRIYCSYLEIYNEKIYDLLNYDKNSALAIREDKQGVYVQSLTTVLVRKEQDVLKLLRTGASNRSIAQTDMNDRSSRSHTIFQLILEQERMEGNEQIRCVSKLNLVDLAGSEKWNTWRSTATDNRRIQEMLNINQSLSNLGNCISALNDTNRKHVPYRDSKLTRLLQDSLGGNCRTFFISTISPSILNYEETISTLKFSDRANRVTIRASRNELLDDATLLKRYEKEIERLQKLLHKNKWRERVKELEMENENLKLENIRLSELISSASQQQSGNSNAQLLDPTLLSKFNQVEKIAISQKEREKELDTYHEWLHSIPVKYTNGEYSVELKDRLVLLEKSVQMQQSELRRAKKLFLQDTERMQAELQEKDRELQMLRSQVQTNSLSNLNELVNSPIQMTPRFIRSDSQSSITSTSKVDFDLIEKLEEYETIKGTTNTNMQHVIQQFKKDLILMIQEYYAEATSKDSSLPSIHEEIAQLVEGCCEALSESLSSLLETFSGNNHAIMYGMYNMISSLTISKKKEIENLKRNHKAQLQQLTQLETKPPHNESQSNIISIIKSAISEEALKDHISIKVSALTNQMEFVTSFERKVYKRVGVIRNEIVRVIEAMQKNEIMDPSLSYHRNLLQENLSMLKDDIQLYEESILKTNPNREGVTFPIKSTASQASPSPEENRNNFKSNHEDNENQCINQDQQSDEKKRSQEEQKHSDNQQKLDTRNPVIHNTHKLQSENVTSQSSSTTPQNSPVHQAQKVPTTINSNSKHTQNELGLRTILQSTTPSRFQYPSSAIQHEYLDNLVSYSRLSPISTYTLINQASNRTLSSESTPSHAQISKQTSSSHTERLSLSRSELLHNSSFQQDPTLINKETSQMDSPKKPPPTESSRPLPAQKLQDLSQNGSFNLSVQSSGYSDSEHAMKSSIASPISSQGAKRLALQLPQIETASTSSLTSPSSIHSSSTISSFSPSSMSNGPFGSISPFSHSSSNHFNEASLKHATMNSPSRHSSAISPIYSKTRTIFSKDDLEKKLAEITQSMNDLQSKISSSNVNT